MKSLITAILAGVLGALISALGLLSNFNFYMIQVDLGYDNNLSSYLLGQDGLILSEMFVALIYSVLALLLIVTKNNKNFRIYTIIIGTSRIILSASVLALFWKPGWYFILDPAGSHKYAYVLLLCALIQSITFLTAKSEK